MGQTERNAEAIRPERPLENASSATAPSTTFPDLSPRTDPHVEWWFAHGLVASAGDQPREIMVSLSRVRGRETDTDGFMLLVAARDPASGEMQTLMRFSPELVENFKKDAPADLQNLGLDSGFLQAFTREVSTYGPLRPVITDARPVEMESFPFSVRWGEFRLEHLPAQNAVVVETPLPGSDEVLRFKAAPETAWYKRYDFSSAGIANSGYESCPRLAASGMTPDKPVTGRVWFEHQWGGQSWISGRGDSQEIVGWDWLAINLDDGRDVVIGVVRDMRDHSVTETFAVLFDGTSAPRAVEDVTFSVVEPWISPKTMIRYPVRCRAQVPELGLDVVFEPTVLEQEVPSFGLLNAIWEGAGVVHGTMAGKPVSGHARLELLGYGYVLDFDEYQGRWIERIDQTLRDFLPEVLERNDVEGLFGKPRWAYDVAAQSAMLSEPAWDLMERGGKHWRPIYGYLLVDALGTDPKPYETMLAAIPELVHNGSVMIDDIEDSSLTRRGDMTIHRRYGVPTAINAGNMLYFLPLLSVERNEHLTLEQREALYRATISTFVRSHAGQAQDLYWSKLDPDRYIALLEDPATQELILQTHASKTAETVRATSEAACIIADCDDDLRAVCTRLAETWGTAFQIVDDVNNFSTSARWGKVRGEDIAAGKVSYAIHKAVQLLQGDDRATFLSILKSPERRESPDGLAQAIELVEASGALEICRAEAQAMVVQDWENFSRFVPPSHPKTAMRALIEHLLGMAVEL